MAATNLELKSLASYLCVSCGKVSIDENINVPNVKANGIQLKGLATIAKYLARQSKNKQLLGSSAEEEAQVSQWLEYRVNVIDRCLDKKDLYAMLNELDHHLSDKVYFVGCRLTLADVFIYYGLHYVFTELTFYEKQTYMHVSRWFDNVQYTSGAQQKFQRIYFQKNLLYTGQGH